MIRFPKTKKAALAYRYNRWGRNPDGTAYDPTRCVYQVHSGDRGGMFYQCLRKPGSGWAKLYCKQHALIARQEEERVKAWQQHRRTV